MPDLPASIHRLLQAQNGLMTQAQLEHAGVSRGVIRWNAGRTWRVVLPRTYLVGRDTPTPGQRHIAALLWAGRGAYLAGSTAAALYGLEHAGSRDGHIEVLVPAPKASRHNTFVTVRRTLVDDPGIQTRGPLRLASPARACVDAARRMRRPEDREALVIEVVQRGMASLDDLAEWLHLLRPRDIHALAPALDAAAAGVWSVPEGVLLDVLATSALLPEPWTNPRLRDDAGVPLVSPDVWFDDVAMAVMVHSRRYHADGDAFDATVAADARLTSAGVLVVGVTPLALKADPVQVLRLVEQGYRTAARRPRPDVAATRRHP